MKNTSVKETVLDLLRAQYETSWKAKNSPQYSGKLNEQIRKVSIYRWNCYMLWGFRILCGIQIVFFFCPSFSFIRSGGAHHFPAIAVLAAAAIIFWRLTSKNYPGTTAIQMVKDWRRQYRLINGKPLKLLINELNEGVQKLDALAVVAGSVVTGLANQVHQLGIEGKDAQKKSLMAVCSRAYEAFQAFGLIRSDVALGRFFPGGGTPVK